MKMFDTLSAPAKLCVTIIDTSKTPSIASHGRVEDLDVNEKHVPTERSKKPR
jgi:hypothetical protein